MAYDQYRRVHDVLHGNNAILEYIESERLRNPNAETLYWTGLVARNLLSLSGLADAVPFDGRPTAERTRYRRPRRPSPGYGASSPCCQPGWVLYRQPAPPVVHHVLQIYTLGNVYYQPWFELPRLSRTYSYSSIPLGIGTAFPRAGSFNRNVENCAQAVALDLAADRRATPVDAPQMTDERAQTEELVNRM